MNGPTAHHFRKLQVLIIEDNADLAANIGDFLEDRGHVIDYAMDGISGLHLALTLPFDVIVLDIMLPGIDGDDTMPAISRRDRKIKPDTHAHSQGYDRG